MKIKETGTRKARNAVSQRCRPTHCAGELTTAACVAQSKQLLDNVEKM